MVLLAGCAPSRESRIRKSAFDTWPPEVQATVREGRVHTGFTEEMVLVALGKPDRKSVEKTEKGEVTVWSWTESRPGLGLSLGMGTGSRYGVGTGVSIGSGTGGRVERMRVTFQDGKVVGYSTR